MARKYREFELLQFIQLYLEGKSHQTLSERDSQYTSHGFSKVIKDNELIHSMSGVSKCIDNGPMEGETIQIVL